MAQVRLTVVFQRIVRVDGDSGWGLVLKYVRIELQGV